MNFGILKFAYAWLTPLDNGLSTLFSGRMSRNQNRPNQERLSQKTGLDGPESQHKAPLPINTAESGFPRAATEMLMDYLLEGTNGSFEEPDTPDAVWSKILARFTHGVRMDALLQDAFDTGYMDDYEGDTREYLRFFLSKLHLKCGMLDKSSECLYKIMLSDRAQLSPRVEERLMSLARIRFLINNPRRTEDRHKDFDHAIGSLQDLRYASDFFKSYESASAIGAEITNASSDFRIVDARLVERLGRLHAQHKKLTIMNPQVLKNSNWLPWAIPGFSIS